MAGKAKEMSQIKQLLLLKKDGVSNRSAFTLRPGTSVRCFKSAYTGVNTGT